LKPSSHSNKISVLKDTLKYSTASYIAQFLGVINSVALRNFMGPAAMGVWSILQVILGYCGYASFGTTKAMARDYPYLRGKGQHEKAEQLKDMTLTFSIVMSVIPAILIVAYLIVKWHHLNPSFRIGLIFISAFLFLQRFYDLLVTLLRSDKKFDVLSQLIVVNALGGLAVTFLFVYKWNIYGLLAGTLFVTLGCFFFIQKIHPYSFRRYWDTAELWKELRLGLPLVLIAFLAQFLKSLDKLIIAKKLGFADVGLYSIAMMIHTYLLSLPMQFAHVTYPTMQHEYGKKESAHAVQGYLMKPVYIFAVLIPFLSGVAIFLAPPVIDLFLPKFVPGIPAMKIYIVCTYFLILVQFSSSFLVTLDKYWINVPILLFSIGLNLVLNLTLLHYGWGLEGVALGTLVSFIAYGVLTFCAALMYYDKIQKIISKVLKLHAVLIFLFGLIFLLDHYLNMRNLYLEALTRVAVFTGSSLPLFWLLEKKMHLIKMFREIRSKKSSPAIQIETAADPDESF